jgi:molybdopterin-guanine dinucleotide biosynthesis protein A
MGRDKSLVLLKSKPLIQHTLERAQRLKLPVILITNHPDAYQVFGIPTYGDVLAQKGSIIGLHSALYHSPTPYTLCLACDMPLLNVDLLRHLITLRDRFDAVVPCPAQRPEPLHALYHQDCLTAIDSQITQGDMQIARLYVNLRVRYVSDAEIRAFDPDLQSFTNANTPEDMAAIESLL